MPILTNLGEERMTKVQTELFDERAKKMKEIANKIETLPISDKWVKRFTHLCFYRTWFELNKTQQSMMINIATTDSKAVIYLLEEHFKKIGLEKLERISVELKDEKSRVKAMQYILENGAKKARNYIDLLIAAEEHSQVA